MTESTIQNGHPQRDINRLVTSTKPRSRVTHCQTTTTLEPKAAPALAPIQAQSLGTHFCLGVAFTNFSPTLNPPMSDDQPPSTTPSSSSTSSETGYTFTSDPWIRWRNTFRYLTGQLTPEGNRQYKQGRDERFAAADCKRCEDQRDYLLQYSRLSWPNSPSF